MARIGKFLYIFLIVLLVVTSTIFLLVKPVNAQSTSKPSAPKFSIQFSKNNTIQLVIQNQEFTTSNSVNSIIYYYRVKDPYSPRSCIDRDYVLQSDSKTTTITIPPVPDGMLFSQMVNRTLGNNSTLIDFQVQAVSGYYTVTQKQGPIPGGPLQYQSPDGYTEITFNESQASDWSNPITVDLSKMAVVTLTPTPSVPEFPIKATLVAILVAVGLLLIISKKRLSIEHLL
jgi:hypothetical protein